MRRPPLSCRRAVQSFQSSSQHIWISDDLLNLAVSQFFRTACPHQKRHGSNVPGPLEARRRATKRRMTVSANFYPQEGLPPPINLGALFGFRKASQPSWRYEPPSLPHTDKPLDFPFTTSNSTTDSNDTSPTVSTSPLPDSSPQHAAQSLPQSFMQSIFKGNATPVVSSVEGTESRGEEAVADPQSGIADFVACFEKFKAHVAHAGDLSEVDQENLLTTAYHSRRPNNPESWVYNIMVVKHLTELGLDPTPLFRRTSLFSVPPIYTVEHSELLGYLKTLSARLPHRLRELSSLNMKLANAALEAKASSSSAQDSDLLLLIQQSWELANAGKSEFQHGTMSLLRQLATKIKYRRTSRFLESILADKTAYESTIMYSISIAIASGPNWALTFEQVLSCIPREHLWSICPSITLRLAKAAEGKVQVSSTDNRKLSFWLGIVHSLDHMVPSQASNITLLDATIGQLAKYAFADRIRSPRKLRILLHAVLCKLSYEDDSYATSYERLVQLIDAYTDRPMEKGNQIQPGRVLGTVVSMMQKQALPYQQFTSLVSTLVAEYARLDSLLHFLTRLHLRNITMPGFPTMKTFIIDKVRELEQAPSMTQRERQINTRSLRTCQSILKVLSQITSSPVEMQNEVKELEMERQFQHLLERAEACGAMPISYRSPTTALTLEQRTIIIHQLAQHYSIDKAITQREALRRLYYLYNHLQHSGLPINPLFTKAVVRIAIARPLSENRFVSARMLIWVCQLVAKVEGEDVAKKLESDFWHWRGDLIRHTKTKFVEAGGDGRGKSHISTMKKLGLI